MRRAVYQHMIAALLACTVVFTVVPFVDTVLKMYSRHYPAIVWRGVNVVTDTVKPGDPIEIVYRAVINKQCPADIRGFIVAPDGTVPVRFPTVSGGYASPAPGSVDIKVKINMPKSSDAGLALLKSGPHIYRAIATRYCPDGVEDDNSIPDAKFTLVVDK